MSYEDLKRQLADVKNKPVAEKEKLLSYLDAEHQRITSQISEVIAEREILAAGKDLDNYADKNELEESPAYQKLWFRWSGLMATKHEIEDDMLQLEDAVLTEKGERSVTKGFSNPYRRKDRLTEELS